MFNRSAIMQNAWTRYRNVPLARFCRERFRVALRLAWTAARRGAETAAPCATPAPDLSTIMRSAWTRFQANRRTGRPFDRALFGQCLRAAWMHAKDYAAFRARKSAPIIMPPAPALSPMEVAIDGLKYLPAHMSAARAEAEIRARFAATR